jgi:seryl-tRNA synthetase
MSTIPDTKAFDAPKKIPFFGARKIAQELVAEVGDLRAQLSSAHRELQRLGAYSLLEIQRNVAAAQVAAQQQAEKDARDHEEAKAKLQMLLRRQEEVHQSVVKTEDIALLQESGVYRYHHPLTDAVAFRAQLDRIEDEIKSMVKKDGGAVLATTSWMVNNSEAKGRAMVRDFSKLMLRAFNAEADNLARGLKPYKLDAAVERLVKVADTIARLGGTMDIRISPPYLALRVQELQLTADFVQRQAEEKDAERAEKDRLREERKVQQELERERARLMKERQHFDNALNALIAKGDEDAAARIREQLADVDRAISDVDYREANIRAGYVYVISNIGSFGESMVKVGMTRRLDPMDRIRELSDASVPFNFDVHALFFSKDAVGIETAMHNRLAAKRVNIVNRRREFFRATAVEAREHLSQLAGELLEFQDIPEALEYRQSLQPADTGAEASGSQ